MTGRLVLCITIGFVVAACEPNLERSATPPFSPPISPSPTAAFSPFPAPSPSGSSAFHGTVEVVDAETRAGMIESGSWKPGCPVSIEDLRILRLGYWGFDGAVHEGELVVNKDVATDVVGVFRALFANRFPIRRMVPVDAFGADDDRSMAANNTVAFNCRPVTGATGVWSQHAYGRAIDINPVQNPYVSGTTVAPRAGEAFLDRSLAVRGMIHSGDTAVRAFEAIGWGWGGSWHSLKDYQHFSATGT